MKPIDSSSFPPPVFKHFGGEILEMDEKKSLTCSFKLKPEYQNPMGIILGGLYGVFFDLAMGPFSYFITGKPCTSLDLNIDFLKPLSLADKKVIIKSEVLIHTKSFLIFTAKALKNDGTLVAVAKSRMMILSEKRMK